jgi:hypothetical protein
MDYGQREGGVVKGGRQIRMRAPRAGSPVRRSVRTWLTSERSATVRATPDSASDCNFEPQLPVIGLGRANWLLRHGLRHLHQTVVQSQRQAKPCLQRHGWDAICGDSCNGHQVVPGQYDGPLFWVGPVKPSNTTKLLPEAAAHPMQCRHRLLGGAAAVGIRFEALQRRAFQLGDVEITSFVPYAVEETRSDGASPLLSTSVTGGLSQCSFFWLGREVRPQLCLSTTVRARMVLRLARS